MDTPGDSKGALYAPKVNTELFQDDQKTILMLYMITQVLHLSVYVKGEGKVVDGAFFRAQSSRVWNFYP